MFGCSRRNSNLDTTRSAQDWCEKAAALLADEMPRLDQLEKENSGAHPPAHMYPIAILGAAPECKVTPMFRPYSRVSA